MRKIIHTANAIESLHNCVGKSVRNKGHFPSDEAATKLIWPALRASAAKWNKPSITEAAAKSQFAMQFNERFWLDE